MIHSCIKNHPKDLRHFQKETCFSEGERPSSHYPTTTIETLTIHNSKCSIQPATANATLGDMSMLPNQNLGYSNFMDYTKIRAKDS